MSYEVDPVFRCHLWTGRLDKDGYGYHGRSRAHIVAWVAENGPIPAGLEVEHGCRRRSCVNVAHLDLVTRSQNEQLKSWRVRAHKAKCKNGHALGMNAMVTPEGGRVCRTCSKEEA